MTRPNRRFTEAGEPAGEVFLPVDREIDLVDLAASPDGTLWLVGSIAVSDHGAAAIHLYGRWPRRRSARWHTSTCRPWRRGAPSAD